MSKPTPESVREALEHTYHSAWNSEAFQREGMNAQRKGQADAVLRWLWEEREPDNDEVLDAMREWEHLFADNLYDDEDVAIWRWKARQLDEAMRCADVLYRKDKL